MGSLEHGKISPAEVKRARDAWIEAVKTLNPDNVAKLYATPDSTGARGWLLGTVDTRATYLRQNSDKIKEYFVGFLAKDKIEPNFPETVTEDDIIQLGPGVVAYNGYYDFHFWKGGKQTCAHAKFTYIYQRNPKTGGLDIILHNSGLTPEGVTGDTGSGSQVTRYLPFIVAGSIAIASLVALAVTVKK
ncbi:unnamed protein product [Vitrella brassicaformis CCMP3155]|uniref:SnoaL-like domain-containing protein n=2 Tax=Vitrella brassicaformis TaxID=1169539 RepID=A0A0G4EUH5_VITBC|nr:unnamed protein product [Vitrella brassicaformis CCMP3155]|eukprot:CEM02078.1 unnamed protein product [Vitrella brassicaformis CCMP3155]